VPEVSRPDLQPRSGVKAIHGRELLADPISLSVAGASQFRYRPSRVPARALAWGSPSSGSADPEARSPPPTPPHEWGGRSQMPGPFPLPGGRSQRQRSPPPTPPHEWGGRSQMPREAFG